MARLPRRHKTRVKRPLLEKFLGIMRGRFPATTLTALTLHEGLVNGMADFRVEATLPRPSQHLWGTRSFHDLMDCLDMLRFTYRNVTYSITD